MQHTTIQIPSVVDESARLPEVYVAQGDKVVVDLKELKLMNSAGIRLWIRWILPLTKTAKVQLTNCPMIFLNLSSIVMDVVPDQVKIESFSLNYLHLKDDREIKIHVEISPKTQSFEIPEIIITDDGEQYEFDGMIAKTFSRFKGTFHTHASVRSSQFNDLGIRFVSAS